MKFLYQECSRHNFKFLMWTKSFFNIFYLQFNLIFKIKINFYLKTAFIFTHLMSLLENNFASFYLRNLNMSKDTLLNKQNILYIIVIVDCII